MKPKALVMVFLALLLVGLYFSTRTTLGSVSQTSQRFTVLIEHFGVSAREIEESITKPLENTVSDLPGIKRLESQSELGQSKVFLTLQNDVKVKDFFLDLRDRVERVYSSLPKSVQKPQIFNGNVGSAPVFIVSFYQKGKTLDELREEIEKKYKPLFQKIEGTGQIEIGGGGLKEIHVKLRSQFASQVHIGLNEIQSFLSTNHLQIPLGKIQSGKFEFPVVASGRFSNLEELRNAVVFWDGDKKIRFTDVADVDYGYRDEEIISRVNGEKRVVLYISKTDSANTITVCSQLNSIVESLHGSSLETLVLQNEGKTLFDSLLTVLEALTIGLGLTLAVLFFFLPNVRTLLILGLMVPVTLIFSLAVMALTNQIVDQYFLSGLVIGIGLIVDNAFIVQSGRWKGLDARSFVAPLIASATATLIVFLPLFSIASVDPSVVSISKAVCLTILIQIVLNLFFLPAFLSFVDATPTPRRMTWISQKLTTTVFPVVHFSLKRKRIVLATLVGILIVIPSMLILLPKDIGGQSSDDLIFGQIEFPSGTSLFAVDEEIVKTFSKVHLIPGVKSFETSARRASAQFSVKLESSNEKKSVVAALKKLAQSLPSGFLYIPDEAPKDLLSVELALTGNDDAVLKKLAKEVVKDLQGQPWVTEGVLHFKEDPPGWDYRPSVTALAGLGLSFSDVGNSLRSHIQGPVNLKWIEKDKEMDLRVFGTNDKISFERLQEIVLNNTKANVFLNQAGQWTETRQSSNIQRLGRQRAALFSIKVKNLGIDEIENRLSDFQSTLRLPKDVLFQIDPTLHENKENYNRGLWILLGSLALVFVVLVTLFESLRIPLLIFLVLPASFVLPLIGVTVLIGKIQIHTIISFVVLTGMAVNNAIILLESLTKGRLTTLTLFHVLKERVVALFVTTSCAIVSSLPLLFHAGFKWDLSSILSVVIVLGTLGSFAATYSLLPFVIQKFLIPSRVPLKT